MEREFLQGIDFQLFVDQERWRRWVGIVRSWVGSHSAGGRRRDRERERGYGHATPSRKARARSISPPLLLSTPTKQYPPSTRHADYMAVDSPTPASNTNTGSKRPAQLAFSPPSFGQQPHPAKRREWSRTVPSSPTQSQLSLAIPKPRSRNPTPTSTPSPLDGVFDRLRLGGPSPDKSRRASWVGSDMSTRSSSTTFSTPPIATPSPKYPPPRWSPAKAMETLSKPHLYEYDNGQRGVEVSLFLFIHCIILWLTRKNRIYISTHFRVRHPRLLLRLRKLRGERRG